MGAFFEIETGFESHQRGQRSLPQQSARFPATLALLRPPAIPTLDSIVEPAWGCAPLPVGPNRETLVSGLLTLNGLGIIDDASLLRVLDQKPCHLSLWQYVQTRFSAYPLQASPGTLASKKDLIVAHFPITKIAERALEWFDLGAISHDLIEAIARFPLLTQAEGAGLDICESFGQVVKELSSEISAYLNTRFQVGAECEKNSIECRSRFVTSVPASLEESTLLFMDDFVVFQNGFPRSSVRTAYWNAFLCGIDLTKRHLMPMMTVDDLADIVCMYDEERFDEFTLISAELAGQGIADPSEEQVNNLIDGQRVRFDFIGGADDFFHAKHELHEMDALKNTWEMGISDEMPKAHEFGDFLKALPKPANDTEFKLRDWLCELSALLPKNKDQQTPMQEIFEHSECDGSPFEQMFLIGFEDNDTVNENLQRFFEGYMESGNENAYRLDWTISAGKLIEAQECLAQLSKLFDKLEGLTE